MVLLMVSFWVTKKSWETIRSTTWSRSVSSHQVQVYPGIDFDLHLCLWSCQLSSPDLVLCPQRFGQLAQSSCRNVMTRRPNSSLLLIGINQLSSNTVNWDKSTSTLSLIPSFFFEKNNVTWSCVFSKIPFASEIEGRKRMRTGKCKFVYCKKVRRTDFTDRTRNFHTIDIYNYWRNGTRMSDVS